MNEEVLSNLIVIKRDGKKVNFDGTKIAVAIKKGFDSMEEKYKEDDINKVYNAVIDKIIKLKIEKIKIEEIQDLIEEKLEEKGYLDVLKSFSEYREQRAQSREIFFEEKRKHKFLKALEKLGLNTKDISDNSFVNRNSIETMQAYGSTISEEFATSYLIKKRFSDCHENGDIHINDLAYYPMGTTESCHIDLEKLFKDGFSTENCSMREPQSISSYGVLAMLAIEENQKDQSKEQSIPAFDFYMATGVLKTFKKIFRQTIYDLLEYTDFDKFIAINGIEREIDKLSTINFDITQFYKFTRDSEELKRMFRIVYDKTMKKTENQVFQAMEGFVHDINSLCNGKITTINLGTDTSAEGRMITKSILKTVQEGVGENKTPKSPIIVFKVKKGINYNEKDENFDLLKYACEVSCNSNNISFSFLDAQFNEQYYKEGDFNTEVAYFEDGTRVIDNIIDSDKRISVSRGVISSTTINLPRIALKHRENIEDFFEELNQKMELIKDQLLERLEIQSSKKVYNFPFLIKQNIWIDSEKLLREDDRIKRVIKQGEMQILFLGLQETIMILIGENRVDNKKAQDLGLKIVTQMSEKVKEFSEKYNLNFSLAGDNNKELAKEFLDFDRVIFGKIKNVTDKENYTLSFELPENTDINKKIKIEAPYHELTNGGHSLRIKLLKKQKPEIINIIKELYKNEIGYASIKGME